MVIDAKAPRDERPPAVTIVIPTYNRASLIGQALDSLSTQTLQDFEVIVVDDGSTDDTAAVLARHPLPVRYVHTSHVGPAVARNIGMRAATGRYVAHLDSDDLYYPYKLAMQVEWLDRHPEIGMVYTEFSAFSDDGFWDERHLTTYHESGYRHGKNRFDRLFSASEPLAAPDHAPGATKDGGAPAVNAYYGNIYDTYLKETVVFTNSMMFRRELLDRAGYQSRRFGHFHDLEFALRLCKASPVGFLDIPTYKLRYHPGQVTSNLGQRGARVALKKQQDLLRVLRVHAATEPSYYRAHKQQLDDALGRLARAAAIPLMTFGAGTRHQGACYPRRARAYLRFAANHGRRFPILTLLTYTPELVRRAYFAISGRLPQRGFTVYSRDRGRRS